MDVTESTATPAEGEQKPAEEPKPTEEKKVAFLSALLILVKSHWGGYLISFADIGEDSRLFEIHSPSNVLWLFCFRTPPPLRLPLFCTSAPIFFISFT